MIFQSGQIHKHRADAKVTIPGPISKAPDWESKPLPFYCKISKNPREARELTNGVFHPMAYACVAYTREVGIHGYRLLQNSGCQDD